MNIKNAKSSVLRRLTVTPAIIIMTCIMVYPIIYNVYISFRYVTLVNLKTNGVFVGLDNYITLFQDEAFIASMITTIKYVIVTVLLQVLIAFILGMLTYRERTVLRKVTTISLLLPKMVTPSASALIWRFMLNYETGIINYFLTVLNLPKVAFLTNASTAMISLSVIGVWQNVGFSYLLILSGLMAISYEIIEASLVEGANLLNRIRYIIFPAMKPVLTVVTLFAVINAYQTFDSVYITTGGGPAEATQVASIFLYRKLFMSSQMGIAASISVILLIVSFLISLILIKALKRRD